MNVQAPIATAEDRKAISWIIWILRSDWDRKGIESALAKHPCQELDVLTLQAIIAAVTRPDQKTPAILGLDGDHTNRARAALSKPTKTPQPLTQTERGGDCGYPGCGIPQAMHRGARFPGDVRPHEWEQPRPITPASAEQIARLKPEFKKVQSFESTRQETSHE